MSWGVGVKYCTTITGTLKQKQYQQLFRVISSFKQAFDGLFSFNSMMMLPVSIPGDCPDFGFRVVDSGLRVYREGSGFRV